MKIMTVLFLLLFLCTLVNSAQTKFDDASALSIVEQARKNWFQTLFQLTCDSYQCQGGVLKNNAQKVDCQRNICSDIQCCDLPFAWCFSYTCSSGVLISSADRTFCNTSVCTDSECCERAIPPSPVVIDCIGSFTASACSTTCGDGQYTSTYSITTTAANGGAACPYSDGYSIVNSPCIGMGMCPVCTGYFTTEACSATCGDGTQTETYVNLAGKLSRSFELLSNLFN